jgi:hypothetical protein
VHAGYPGGRFADAGAQFRRVDDLRLGAEGEHVEHRDAGGVDPHPGLDPALPPGDHVGAAADPDARGPAEQGGQAPASRRQQDPGPLHGRAGRLRASGPGAPGRGGRGGKLAAEPIEQLESALAAADRVHRDPGGAERLDVTQHRARRHLELGGQLPGGHPAPGL